MTVLFFIIAAVCAVVAVGGLIAYVNRAPDTRPWDPNSFNGMHRREGDDEQRLP